VPNCEVCGKEFDRQIGSGTETESTASSKCSECAAKNILSTPPPAKRNASREDAAAFTAEMNRIAPARPFITWIIIAVCTAVFAIEIIKGAGFDTMSPDLAIRLGANYGPQTMSGQWWRLFTSMFLHFGFLHLFMNMLILWSLGSLAERLMGRAAYLVLYFGTGLCGGLLSLAVHPQLVSAGASGAVFGISGGLITYLALKKAPLSLDRAKKQLTTLGIFLAYSFIGSLKPGIDMMAHAGGLVSGLAMAAALPRFLNIPSAEITPAPIEENSSVNKRITQVAFACAIVVLLGAFAAHRLQADSIYVLSSLSQIDAGKSADVIPTLEKIIVRQPNSSLAHFALGVAYFNTNQGPSAIRELSLADKLKPGDPTTEQELGASYLSQNDFANALTYFREVVATQPASISARIGLAASLFGLGQYQEAATESRRVLTTAPNDSNAHSILGQADLRLGSNDEGIHEIETSLKLDPSNTELRALLLIAYNTTGHKDRPPLP
jgi:membrane associated rhomboid family serine protease/Flp pilus assembly protein TadD